MEAVEKGDNKHPKPAGTFSYGTAGFRMKASLLDSVMYRTGILAVLRAKVVGKYIGVMMTASHNPEEDNGVKLVEPLGEMLVSSWEALAIELANTTDLVGTIKDIIKRLSIDMSAPAKVVVARDTRPSGEALVASLKDGIEAMGGQVFDFDFKTTPQLHYITRCLNDPAFGEPTEQGYYDKLKKSFETVVGTQPTAKLYVDAANGIGAPTLARLVKTLPQLNVAIYNDDIVSRGKLNHECGADFVKLYQKVPSGIELKDGMRACSLDGDADRIVFYYHHNGFRLLDGDKIATLAAKFIMGLIREANISNLNVGVVQTAYANGSSTAYIKETLQVPVVFTCTGVKHLHHAAEEFDVGVYFEANGHGTVLFSPAAIQAFKKSSQNPREQNALTKLNALVDLINQTVGDALSDLLLVEAILTNLQLSFEDWDACYTDLPSKQEKVKVKDRSIFVPINADTELSKPEGLQSKINAIVAKFEKGRCFVRPSGTEDIVRVYGESASQEQTNELVKMTVELVKSIQ